MANLSHMSLPSCAWPFRLFALFFLIFVAMACGKEETAKTGQNPAPVQVGVVEQGNITRTINAVGNVAPSVSVAITPRVDGEILDIYFTEGDDVRAGQRLLQIDPRPYEAILSEKRATLAKSRAQLNKAKHDRGRYAKLAADGYVSREAFEQTETDAAAIAATVDADKAAVDKAALDLSYCDIIAPINGRIGELKLHKGNMVKTNDSTPIATIDAITPCYVSFFVPEAHLPVLLEQMRTARLPVTATPVGGQPSSGILTLVDNRVDARTGSIRLRATFPNKEKHLWPGQFVELELPLGVLENTLLIPTRAISRGREEAYVYVVNSENKAEYRKISPLFASGGKTAVTGDLSPGEKVVIEGQIRLAPGFPVEVLP